jgi:hypothetical protein
MKFRDFMDELVWEYLLPIVGIWLLLPGYLVIRFRDSLLTARNR